MIKKKDQKMGGRPEKTSRSGYANDVDSLGDRTRGLDVVGKN